MNAFGHEQWKCDKNLFTTRSGALTIKKLESIHTPQNCLSVCDFQYCNVGHFNMHVYGDWLVFCAIAKRPLEEVQFSALPHTAAHMITWHVESWLPEQWKNFYQHQVTCLRLRVFFKKTQHVLGCFQGFSVMDRYWDCGLHDFLPGEMICFHGLI